MSKINIFNNNECNKMELKNIINDCLKKVQFINRFDYTGYEIEIVEGKNDQIKGYLKKDNENLEIFHLRFEDNEIKRFCVAYSLRRNGIGTAIIKFIIDKCKNNQISGKLYVKPDGYSCGHDDFSGRVFDNGCDKDISRGQRIQFYRNLGFIEDSLQEDCIMYVMLKNNY